MAQLTLVLLLGNLLLANIVLALIDVDDPKTRSEIHKKCINEVKEKLSPKVLKIDVLLDCLAREYGFVDKNGDSQVMAYVVSSMGDGMMEFVNCLGKTENSFQECLKNLLLRLPADQKKSTVTVQDID